MTLGVLVLFLAVAVGAQDPEEYRLIWEDNFDFFDPSKWEQEVTAWGGGVRKEATASLGIIIRLYKITFH